MFEGASDTIILEIEDYMAIFCNIITFICNSTRIE